MAHPPVERLDIFLAACACIVNAAAMVACHDDPALFAMTWAMAAVSGFFWLILVEDDE